MKRFACPQSMGSVCHSRWVQSTFCTGTLSYFIIKNATVTIRGAFKGESIPPSRVETQKILVKQRLWQRIASLISTVKHCSVKSVYQCHWLAWVRWATEWDFNPLPPTVTDFSEYCLALYRQWKSFSSYFYWNETKYFFTMLWQCGCYEFSPNQVLHDLLSLCSLQPVLHDWCNKGHGMCYPVWGMVHIKEPLLLIGKSSLCGGSGFPFSLSVWSLTICLTPYNCK